QPNLALAAAHDIVVGAFTVIQGWQLTAQVDNVLVTIFPAVKERQGFNDAVGADFCAELAHARSLRSSFSKTYRLRAALLRSSSRGSTAGRIPGRRARSPHWAPAARDTRHHPPAPAPCRNRAP